MILTASILLFVLHHSAGSQTCLSCQGAVKPSSCETITRCGKGESCHTEAIVTSLGFVRYNLGCKDSQQCSTYPILGHQRRYIDQGLMICTECCDGDLCNNAGCGTDGYPSPTTRGPLCYTCQEQSSTDDCNQISLCAPEEVCLLSSSMNHVTHDTMFNTRCAQAAMCSQLHGTPTAQGACQMCCLSDLCNNQCNMTNTTSVTTTVTSANTTMTSVTTTMPSANTTVTSANTTMPSANTTMTSANTTMPPVTTNMTSVNTTMTSVNTTMPSANTTMASVTTSMVSANTTITSVNTPIASANTTMTSANTTMPSVTTIMTSANTTLPSVTTTMASANTTMMSVTTTMTSVNTNMTSVHTTVTSPPGKVTSTPDPCSSNPCVSGVCSQYSDTYKCTCGPDAYGRNCDQYLDHCVNHPCVHGHCVSSHTSYNCTCFPGFTGEHCDTATDHCLSNPCQYGTCSNSSDTFTCTCFAGYEGPTCDMAVASSTPSTTSSTTSSTTPSTTATTTTRPSTTKAHVHRNCKTPTDCKNGLAPGDYQSCTGCHYYLTCSNTGSWDRPCGPSLFFDSKRKICDFHSTTCGHGHG